MSIIPFVVIFTLGLAEGKDDCFPPETGNESVVASFLGNSSYLDYSTVANVFLEMDMLDKDTENDESGYFVHFHIKYRCVRGVYLQWYSSSKAALNGSYDKLHKVKVHSWYIEGYLLVNACSGTNDYWLFRKWDADENIVITLDDFVYPSDILFSGRKFRVCLRQLEILQKVLLLLSGVLIFVISIVCGCVNCTFRERRRIYPVEYEADQTFERAVVDIIKRNRMRSAASQNRWQIEC
jgi:hypothetical protein